MTLVLKCFDRSEPHPSGLSSRRASRGWGKAGNRPGRGELQRGWSGAELAQVWCCRWGCSAQSKKMPFFLFFFNYFLRKDKKASWELLAACGEQAVLCGVGWNWRRWDGGAKYPEGREGKRSSSHLPISNGDSVRMKMTLLQCGWRHPRSMLG